MVARFSADHRRLARLRLAAQRIGAGAGQTPVDVVRAMLAMQGQDYPGVRWSVGVRSRGSTDAAVEAAFDRGEIVRSWPMRGTLHMVAAEDLGWMLPLTTPRAVASLAARRAYLGITDVDAERAREIAVAALRGGCVLARVDLLAALAAGGVATAGQRGYHLLWFLAQTGTLVLGPTRGGQQTFALLDEWVREPRRLERDEALGELVRRYFRGHGPATERDLARWAGLTLGDVRRGLAVGGAGLVQLELQSQIYHLAPETLAAARQAPADARPARVHLLPGFDEYLLGYADRTAVLRREWSQAVVPGANGMFKPTIVADGRVVGTWRRTFKRGEAVIEPTPFEPLRSWIRAGIEEAAQAYASFVGRAARVAQAG